MIALAIAGLALAWGFSVVMIIGAIGLLRDPEGKSAASSVAIGMVLVGILSLVPLAILVLARIP